MTIQEKIGSLISHSAAAFGVFMAAFGWPLLSAWLSSASRAKDLEAWEAWALKNPRWAAWIERARALGLDWRKVLDISRREAARRAGQMPLDSAVKLYLPDSLASVLADPAKRDKLVNFVVSLSEPVPSGSDPSTEPTVKTGTEGAPAPRE